MIYNIGDTVDSNLNLEKYRKENIIFIEKSRYEETFYINGFNRWVYKIPGKKLFHKFRQHKLH
jgi:hypothetical protein